jgi:hypothetical protein
MSVAQAAPAAATSAAPVTGGLFPRLLDAMRGLERVPERGWNASQSYSYVREDDLVEAVRDRLLNAGVLLLPSVQAVETRDTSKLDRDTGAVIPGWPITRVVVSWSFIDAATGEREVLQGVGDGADPGDKGVYKALTGSLKYVLRQSFLIPTGDDAESDTGGVLPQAGAGARTTGSSSSPASSSSGARRLATDGQRRMLFARARSHGLSDPDRDTIIRATCGAGSLDDVPMDAVDPLLQAFARGVVPTGRSDVPVDDGPPLPADGDDIPF